MSNIELIKKITEENRKESAILLFIMIIILVFNIANLVNVICKFM